jgi:hypothetical protein
MEARAIISAQDKTGAVFDKIGAKLDRLAAKGKSVDGFGRSLASMANVPEFERQAARFDRVVRRMDDHARRVRQIEAAASRVERFWAGARDAMAAASGSRAVLGLARRSAQQGAEYQGETQHLRNVGRTPQDMHEIEAKAAEVARNVPTSTFAENVKAINETIGAFGDLHHALDNLEAFQKIASVVKSIAGDKLHMDGGQMAYYMARFGEMRGTVQDPARFRAETNALGQAMYFMRGNFNPMELYHFGRRAGSGTLRNYDDDFVSRILPSIITEVGGDTAGVQARAFRDLIQGRVRDRTQVKAWMDLGLVDPKKVRAGKGGEPISWQADAVKGWEMAAKNPFRWMQEISLPAMKAKGVDVTDPLQMTKYFGEMARNSSGNNFMTMIGDALQVARLMKDSALMNQVHPIDQIYADNLTKNPAVALEAVTAQFNNLLQAASSPMMPVAAEGLARLAGALSTLAANAKDNPALAAMGLGGVTAGAAAGTALAAKGALGAFGVGGGASGGLMLGTGIGGVLYGGSMLSLAAAQHAQANPHLYRPLAENPMLGAFAPDATLAGAIGNAKDYAAQAAQAAQKAAMARDWSLGYAGKFQQYPRTEVEPGSFGQMSGRALSDALKAVNLEASVRQPVPVSVTGDVKGEMTGKFEVTASSELLRMVDGMKTLTAQLRGAIAANGPGSTGKSAPDAAAGSTGGGGE